MSETTDAVRPASVVGSAEGARKRAHTGECMAEALTCTGAGDVAHLSR